MDHFRIELAVLWLHHILREDIRRSISSTSSPSSSPAIPTYESWFHRVLDALWVPGTTGGLEPKDRTFTKFLIDVPEITGEAVGRVVRGYCEDSERWGFFLGVGCGGFELNFCGGFFRMQLGIVTLRDLITYRPAVREECLLMLLEFSLHKGIYVCVFYHFRFRFQDQHAPAGKITLSRPAQRK